MTEENNNQSNFDAYEFRQFAKRESYRVDNYTDKGTLNFTKEDVRTWLTDPDRYYTRLMDVSKYLYRFSPQYKRMINHISGLMLWSYNIEMYGLDYQSMNKSKKKLTKQYYEVASIVDNMNLPHEMLKAARQAYVLDVFYGFEYEEKSSNSYFIQSLNPKFCKIQGVIDGTYIYAFNLEYFNGNLSLLDNYDKSFRSAYLAYKKDRNKQWFIPDTSRQVCFKVNEDSITPVPPFADTFEAVYDIDMAKKLKKSKNESENYKVLIQEIPLMKNADQPNQFAVGLEEAKQFYKMLQDVVPESVGVALSPFEVKAVQFPQTVARTSDIEEASANFWRDTGISGSLFSSDNSTSVAMKASIVADEILAFSFARQVERFINKKLKTRNINNFRVKILNITHYNKTEVHDAALKASQASLPTKTMAYASLGLSPTSMAENAFLENEILNLPSVLIPLSSSHTTTSDEAGRPATSDTTAREGNGDQSADNNDNYK